MGKKRRIQRRAPALFLEDAFEIKSEMLQEIQARQGPERGTEPALERALERAPEPGPERAPEPPAPERTLEPAPAPAPKREKVELLELKKVAPNPEIIEWHDTNAPDPFFLAKLKAHPGAVPVPATWQGREFRSKFSAVVPYRLPKNVYETGIAQQRNVFEQDDKQLAKERLVPKLGTLDLDLEKMRAAFFKNSKKPRLYRFGQVYSPKQEQDIDFSDLRPGVLSDRLKQALGIKHEDAAPWLPLMDREPRQPSRSAPIVHWGR